MASVVQLLSFENDVFKTYVFWAAVLTIKMLLMAVLTSNKRSKAKVITFYNISGKFFVAKTTLFRFLIGIYKS